MADNVFGFLFVCATAIWYAAEIGFVPQWIADLLPYGEETEKIRDAVYRPRAEIYPAKRPTGRDYFWNR